MSSRRCKCKRPYNLKPFVRSNSEERERPRVVCLRMAMDQIDTLQTDLATLATSSIEREQAVRRHGY